MLLPDNQIAGQYIDICINDVLFGQADVFKAPCLDFL